jgi:hypothetical protein
MKILFINGSPNKNGNTVRLAQALLTDNEYETINLLDRLYGAISKREMAGKRLFFLFQGAAPDKWMIEAGEYSIRIFTQLYGLSYMGMATTTSQAKGLSKKL